jgi:pimeloyl-ACP methyl ester carboxylesterase
LLLVHGFLWSGAVWEEVFPRLARHFRVIVPDLPGFGGSEKPSPARYPYGYYGFAESLIDLVAALGVGRVSVCGHSMGGAIAILLAANHPDLVEKLILVDPTVYGARRNLASSIATLPVLGPIVFKQMYGRATFRRFFQENVYARPESAPAIRLERMFETFNEPAAREAAYATMLATLDTRPLVAGVPRVSAPTLVAWGRSDRSVPVEHGRRLARELRRARFEVFDCGHSPAEEVPDALAAVVESFLRGKGP